MTDSERIRKILDISRAEFSRRYHIPVRTLEQWDAGKATPPAYVIELLERVVREDKNMKYAVILSTRGREEVIFVGNKDDAVKMEGSLRKECRRKDPDGTELDCYTISEKELEKREAAKNFYDMLTEEEKHDVIVVDGKKYIRKIYEENNK